jgi:hypothetical protein
MTWEATLDTPGEVPAEGEPGPERLDAHTGPLTDVVPPGWDVNRVVSLLAGTFILFSLVMGRLHDRRWRLMTGLIGANLILQAVAGWCPASLLVRRLGVPDRADS